MANILILNQPFPSVGLSTFTFTVPAAGLYNVNVQATVPSAVGTGDGAGSGGVASGGQNPAVASGVSIVVAQNGSTTFTSPTLTPTQGAQQFKTELVCALNDTITVTPASSTASDNTLNGVQITVSIGQGQ